VTRLGITALLYFSEKIIFYCPWLSVLRGRNLVSTTVPLVKYNTPCRWIWFPSTYITTTLPEWMFWSSGEDYSLYAMALVAICLFQTWIQEQDPPNTSYYHL